MCRKRGGCRINTLGCSNCRYCLPYSTTRKKTSRLHVPLCGGRRLMHYSITRLFCNPHDIPVPLRNWLQERFVKACQELAIKNHFKEVRIEKAHSISSYGYPDIPGAKTEAELGAATEGVRARMLSHYDGTARELGFADRGNWFVWANPSHSLCSARSTSPKVLDPKTPFTGNLGLF